MNNLTINIYHNKNYSLNKIESLFIPIFGHVYSYSILLNMSNHIWCVYRNQNLIGCVLAKKSSTILYLILFGIKENYRTIGIGSHLLSLIINYAKENFFTMIYLHTECRNECAIKFYKKFRFTIDLFIENYYKTMITFYPHAYQMSRKF